MDLKENILATVSDLVAEFLYYGRKEDEELPVGAIQEAVERGEVTEDEIVARFREKLHERMGQG